MIYRIFLLTCLTLIGMQAVAQEQPSTLEPFTSEQELHDFLDTLFATQERELSRQPHPSNALYDVSPPAAAPQEGAAAESITNVQHAGVDEGGIVKVHGDYLVILRRGRLFTVDIGDDSLTPIEAVDAYAPNISAHATWYDEMLISGNVVIVIGYSYQRGGTEVGLFEIGRDGTLRHTSTYHLRSNDYYSSRNYSSRLVDGKLIFYTPLSFQGYQFRNDGIDSVLPAMRRWNTDGEQGDFMPITSATQIFRPARDLHIGPRGGLSLHTVTSCDVSNGEMSCDATAVLGPFGHTFYVSPNSVYVWTAARDRRSPSKPDIGVAYRLPLDGSRPTALGVMGSPIDQFSFLESDDDHLNVLLTGSGGGQWMWQSESPHNELALLRVPLTAFGNGRSDAAATAYTALPSAPGWALRNRFVGDHLLYGMPSTHWQPREEDSKLHVVEWRTGNISDISLAHGVERIEIMGRGAVVIGTQDNDLHFSSVRLNRSPSVVDRYRLRQAAQGESRSHGFFYRPDATDSGVLGLPVLSPGNPSYYGSFSGSASIVFLRNQDFQLADLGELDATSTNSVNDNCVASCVDWYGNARPIFLRGRIFALLGYEIVEGQERNGQILEVQRANFTPERAVVRR